MLHWTQQRLRPFFVNLDLWLILSSVFAAILAVSNLTMAVPVTDASYGTIVTVQPTSTRTAHVETTVRNYFGDIPVMIQVARCESQYRHTLANGSVLRGKVDNDDTGVMQINTRYHEETATRLGLDLENIYDNMAYARYLYEKQGTQPWSASSPCWGKTLAVK